MSDAEKTALMAKIEDLHPDEVVIFSRSEAEALREVAVWWVRFSGAIKIGGALGGFAKWFLVFSALLVAFKAGLIGWISEGLGK